MSRRSASFWDIDWWTVAIYFGLAMIGWFMIYAAGYDPSAPTGFFDLNTEAGKQGLFLLLSALIGSAILLIEPQFFKTISFIIYGVAIFLLLMVMAYGAATNGALSWFSLPGGFKFQPSELAKFATCLALATYLSTNNTVKDSRTAITAIGIFLLPAVLVVLQGDPGSALIFFALMIPLFREGMTPIIYIAAAVFILLFILGLMYNPVQVLIFVMLLGSLVAIANLTPQLWWRLSLAALILGSILFFKEHTLYVLGASTAYLLVALIVNFTKRKKELASFLMVAVLVMSGFTYSVNYLFYNVLESHQRDRINVWLMPEKADPRGSYYNLRQSKLAIGSGGLWGKKYLKGEMTQGNFVPEQHTDFIFTVVGEEQGFMGTFGVIILYLALLLRISMVAERQRSRFTRVYAYGIAGIFSIHLLVNIGMTMGVMPVIGIPLPLMSYGGSSLLSFTVMIAVLLRFDSQRLLVFR